MTSLTDMPADIVEAARKVVIEDLGWDINGQIQDLVVACIADAILAERQRCEGIARNHSDDSDWPGESWMASLIADSIAAKTGIAERQRDQWQDIYTAPKDGTLILVSFGEKGVRAVSWENPWDDERSDDNGIWCVDDDKHGPYPLRRYRDDDPTAPTHWQPLPAPPKKGA